MTTTITQKDTLAGLRNFAADLGAIVSIRKNAHGEYDTRIRMNGSRAYVFTYLATDFLDAEEALLFALNRIKDEQRAEGVRRQREYKAALDLALSQAATILRLVGCSLSINSDDTVTMWSPTTGSHSLTMRLGVRPVSDLLAHVCGFAEQQTFTRSK